MNIYGPYLAEMERQGKLKKDDGVIGIRDLPEQIFRNIFQYIGNYELFSTMRKLNRDVRKYVDNYFPLQGVFVLIREHNVASRLIHIFKCQGENFVTQSSLAQPFPMCEHGSHMQTETTKLHLLPLSIPSNESQGPLLFAIHSNIVFTNHTVCENGVWKPFFPGKVAMDLYEFDVKMCHWKLLKTRYGNLNSQIVSCALINDSTFLMFLRSRHLNKEYRMKLKSMAMDTAPNSFSRNFTGDDERRMNIPKEVNRLTEFSLLSTANNSIALIGGVYDRDRNRVIWQGTLTDGNTKIEWDAIDIGGSWMGYNPICFRLKDNVFITGNRHRQHCTNHNYCSRIQHFTCPSCFPMGNTLDRYDFKEKKMYLNAYSMPYPYTKMYHPVKIATDKKETFAVLVFRNKPPNEVMYPEYKKNYEDLICEEKVLIFTEKEGFVKAEDYNNFVEGVDELYKNNAIVTLMVPLNGTTVFVPRCKRLQIT